jgi:AcrR family transcriptional regulator
MAASVRASAQNPPARNPPAQNAPARNPAAGNPPARNRSAQNPPAVSARTHDVRRTAARLFEQSGYSATTMSDIAEALGILPGSLYHHFASKEEIAVDLISSYTGALTELGTAAARRTEPSPAEPEKLLRQLAADVAALAFRHAAAVRLSAYEAPSVSTERFTAAIGFRSAALDRAWRTAVQSLATGGTHPAADLGLLRFTLQQVTSHAPLYYPADARGDEVSGHLCDILLHGLLAEAPSFDDLDRSAAHRAALDAISHWGSRDHPAPGLAGADGATDDILAAARREFARRGYEATTIRDIARAAGVGMATLYRRVESKESLLRSIIDVYAGCLDEAFGAVMSADSSDAERLYALTRVFGHASRHFDEESRIVSFGWFGREAASSPVHDYFVATQQRFDAMTALLRHGRRAGTVRPVAGPRELAVHFRSVLWLRFHEHARTSEARAFAFLRQSLLQGAVTRP